jgi:hypothetical protein
MLKDMQRKQKDEKALREKQVFKDGSKYQKNKVTVPEQFVLKTGQRVVEK